MQTPQNKSHQKYQSLLFVLLSNFLVSPFLKSGLGSIVSALLLLCTMLIIIHSIKLKKLYIWMFTAIAIIAFIVQINTGTGWFVGPNDLLTSFPLIIFSLYFTCADQRVKCSLLLDNQVKPYTHTFVGELAVYFTKWPAEVHSFQDLLLKMSCILYSK